MVVSRTGILTVLLLLILVTPSVIAGPPFFTDDPEPVEYRHWEIYLASQYLKTGDDRTGTAPHMEVNYGAYPSLQLHTQTPAAFDYPTGGSMAYGYGDTEFGVKYRFLKETDTHPQIGIFPIVEATTGDEDRGLGNGKAQIFLPLWLQKSWGRWTSYGGGGYWINPGVGNKNWGFVGWHLERDLSKYLTLGGEIFHRTADTVGVDGGTGFTGGGQINFNEHYHFLFSAGTDITGPEHLTQYLAIQWTS